MDLDKRHRHIKMAISSSNLEHIVYFYTHTHTEWPTYTEHVKPQNNVEKIEQNNIEKPISKLYIKVLSGIHFLKRKKNT